VVLDKSGHLTRLTGGGSVTPLTFDVTP